MWDGGGGQGGGEVKSAASLTKVSNTEKKVSSAVCKGQLEIGVVVEHPVPEATTTS